MFNAMLKARNKKGFTLMEMLIVVAIIAILVAISIPVFTSQLNNAKEQTDAANLRAAKAVFVTTYLTTGTEVASSYYDAVNGTLVTTRPTENYGKSGSNTVIQGSVNADGEVTIAWLTS